MIAADQNSREHDGVTLDAVEHPSCAGCHFFNAPDGDCKGVHPTLCTNTGRVDGRSIIWVARKPAPKLDAPTPCCGQFESCTKPCTPRGAYLQERGLPLHPSLVSCAENPATVAADILRAQGEDVDEASVKRAEAACEEPVRKSVGIMPTEEWLATVCCGNFESCSKPCTPRGVHLQMAAENRDAFSIIFDDPAYASLGRVLTRAYAQAATGKGAERHGQGQPFEKQVMQDMARRFGVGSLLGQAFKKSEESQRLPRARAVAELLGAINYLAGAVIAIEAGDTHHQP